MPNAAGDCSLILFGQTIKFLSSLVPVAIAHLTCKKLLLLEQLCVPVASEQLFQA